MPNFEFLGISPLTPINALVAEAWAMLSNGMGGLDWKALPFVVQWLHVDDIELLVQGLMTIKTHRKASDEAEPPAGGDHTRDRDDHDFDDD